MSFEWSDTIDGVQILDYLVSNDLSIKDLETRYSSVISAGLLSFKIFPRSESLESAAVKINVSYNECLEGLGIVMDAPSPLKSPGDDMIVAAFRRKFPLDMFDVEGGKIIEVNDSPIKKLRREAVNSGEFNADDILTMLKDQYPDEVSGNIDVNEIKKWAVCPKETVDRFLEMVLRLWRVFNLVPPLVYKLKDRGGINYIVNAVNPMFDLLDVFAGAVVSDEVPVIYYVVPEGPPKIMVHPMASMPSVKKPTMSHGLQLVVKIRDFGPGHSYSQILIHHNNGVFRLEMPTTTDLVLKRVMASLPRLNIDISVPVRPVAETYVMQNTKISLPILHNLLINLPIFRSYLTVNEKENALMNKSKVSVGIIDPVTQKKIASFSFSVQKFGTLINLTRQIGNDWVTKFIGVFAYFYSQEEPRVRALLEGFFPKEAIDPVESKSSVAATKSAVGVLQKFFSDIHGYCRSNQANRPFVISQDEIEEWENELQPMFSVVSLDEPRPIGKYIRNDGDVIYYVCPFNTFPYASGVKSRLAKAAPSCYKDISDGGDPSRRPTDLVTYINSVRFNQRGVVPPIILSHLGQHIDASGGLYRIGSREGCDSLSFLIHVGTGKIKYQSEEKLPDINFGNIRHEVCSQEMYDYTDDQIKESILGGNFDYQLHYRALEIVFGVNLYVYSRRGNEYNLLIPRYREFHARPLEPEFQNCLILVQQAPGKYEIVGHSDHESSRNRSMPHAKYLFSRDVNVVLNQAIISACNPITFLYGDVRKGLTVNFPITQIFPDVTKQMIDQYGKLRIIRTESGLVLVVPPSAPLNIQKMKTKDLALPSDETVKKYLGEPSNVDEFGSHYSVAGIDSGITVPTQKYLMSMIDFNKSELVKKSIENDDLSRSARLLLKLIFWLWSLDSHPPFSDWWNKHHSLRDGDDVLLPYLHHVLPVLDGTEDGIKFLHEQIPGYFTETKIKVSPALAIKISKHFTQQEVYWNYGTKPKDISHLEDEFVISNRNLIFHNMSQYDEWMHQLNNQDVRVNESPVIHIPEGNFYGIVVTPPNGFNDDRRLIQISKDWDNHQGVNAVNEPYLGRDASYNDLHRDENGFFFTDTYNPDLPIIVSKKRQVLLGLTSASPIIAHGQENDW